MKMRRVLALVMAVLMVIGLMPVVAAGDVTTDPVTSVSNDDNGFVHVNKSVNETGTELTLEAYLTNEVTQMVSTKLLDIVLVLDQSGSMADSFGNVTRQAAMKNAVNAFIEEVAAKNADHRMAIVTFGSDAQRLVEWTTVDNSGKTQLTDAINGLPKNPSGATNVGAGMEVAKRLMDSATDTDRQKVVIVFTDGVPTTTNTFSTAVANTAITAAKSMKDSGVTIYAVGIFNGANPDEMYGASGFDTNSDGTVGSQWGEETWGLFPDTDFPKTDRPAGNRFLNLVSSNYLSADSLGLKRNEDGLGILHSAISYKITKNFDRVADVNYYLTAINDTSLTNMFQQIVQEISTLDIVADENTILSDTLSEYFTLNVPEGSIEAGAITVEQWNCTGMDNNGDYTWEKAETQPAIQVAVTGKKIEVTGFNYSENAVTKLTTDNGTQYSGSKLVVTIPIKPDETAEVTETGYYPTNNTTDSKAGLSNYKDKDGNGLDPTLLDVSPEVMIEVAEPEKVTVTFDPDNGEPVSSVDINKGTTVTKPVDPAKDGYKFIGWYAPNASYAFNFDKTIDEDITLTAKWIESENAKYGVTYVYADNVPEAVKEANKLPEVTEKFAINQQYSVPSSEEYQPVSVIVNGFKWTFEKWQLNGVDVIPNSNYPMKEGGLTFVGIWTSEIITPEPPEIMAIVTVKCVNEKTGHKEKAYEVNAGDYTVLNGGVTEVNGEYQYVINLINARYLNAYNADTGAEHRLKENKATEIKFVYEKENGRWIHENPTIEVICEDMSQYYSAKIVSINLLSATAEKPYDGKPLTKDEFESLEIKVRFTNIENSEDTYVRSYFLNDVTITPVAGQDRTYRISLKLDDNRSWQIDVKFTGSQTQVGVSDNTYGIVGFIENDDANSGAIDYLNRITTFNYGKLTVTAKDDPIDPPFIVLFPTLEISNKVIAPKNFEKTSFEYDIINVKTGDVEKSVTLKADSSVRVMVTGGTEYMVVPKNLDVPGYIVTTTSTPDSATVTSDKIGNVSVDFTHIYVVGLNTEDHYAYIRGYEDGTIRPEGNITRAEVATIFYRLLSSEALEAFKTTENTFTDVDSDAWYNLSVSTLAKAGVISGYPDGSFNPNGKITRAELVSIATRFFTTIEVGDSKFSDIAGHWAAKAIDEAYIKGIIKGYSDGTFRPDQAVTRAEAMKIVNGILGRPIDTCVLIEGIKLWPDVASDAWYYYVVAEATNAHRYELTTPEKWTAIIIDEIEY